MRGTRGEDTMGIMVVAFVLLAWFGCGLAIVLTMRRLGHRLVLWLPMIAAGPLAGLLAASARSTESEVGPVELAEGRPGVGTVDVLIGVDGSRESRAAIDETIELFAGTLRTVTLASVVDFETELYPDTSKAPDEAARSLLADERDRLRGKGIEPATALLTGEPATALRDYAVEIGARLIVVGSRGRGASSALLGSAARHLADGTELPVLIVKRGPSGPEAPGDVSNGITRRPGAG